MGRWVNNETEAASVWRRPLPLFIRVIGYLVILYALLMLVAMIGMTALSLYMGVSGSYELHTDFGSQYFENGNSTEPFLIRTGMMLSFLIIATLVFFAGFRMVRGVNEKGLAEYSSLQAFWIAEEVDIVVHEGLGYGFFFSLTAWAIAIVVYFLVRFNLYSLLKRILLEKDLSEADPSTSSG
jgi:hypothetical protein